MAVCLRLIVMALLATVTACGGGGGSGGDDAPAQSETATAQEATVTQDPVTQQSSATATDFQVYKSPTCGCCGEWVDYMQREGFSTAVHHPDNLDVVKLERGIPSQFQSCHTAVSEQGYVFEGHIPARDIRDFLASPPQDAIGLAVPGMPVGSPGMEVGDRFSPYNVLLLKKDGSTEVFRHVATADQQ
ncbi:DUF411 domain-containing protein [Litorivivens sp.]|uniref:DUF411 domain-containing protein n=1 Tax=Litorivivens sp. TaxID=2020868 RepID=UPI003569BCE3